MSENVAGEDKQYVMTQDEIAAYRVELQDELAELEESNAKLPSKYKSDRIKRLRQRLGIVTVE